jgi:transposase
VKSNKNDRADAEAISEAVMRPEMRFVGIKSVEQQEVLSLHRARERWVRNRTAVSNEIRGFLQEYGVVLPQGPSSVRRRVPEMIGDETNGLPEGLRGLLRELYEELVSLETRIMRIERRLQTWHQTHEVCQRLSAIPGVGLMTATALVATVGDPGVFRRGREFAAWLGLVPRQHSSGGKERLLGISKRGDRYVRTLLVHGARAVLQRVNSYDNRRSHWLKQLEERRGFNRACVALANKNARRAWVLMAKGETYRQS